MRVLLYESETGGHRPVVLSYVQRILREHGHEFIVVGKEDEQKKSMRDLQRMAAQERCDLIHIMTADAHTRKWLVESLKPTPHCSRVPVIGTYYLFSTLWHPLKGLVWDWVMGRRLVDRLLISDDYLEERSLPVRRRARLSYLPDPWDPEEFPLMSKIEACHRLGLDANRMRFLLFGSITARKGLDLVAEAYEAMATTGVELTVVGVWHNSLKGDRCERALHDLVDRGLARLHSDYVPEEKVSAWFCAADYVLCAYPRSFAVSSGTCTRACAAGRPIIAPTHGVVGRIVRSKGCGLTYLTDSASALSATLRYALMIAASPEAERMGQIGKAIAAERTLGQYGGCLLRAYVEAITADIHPGIESAH